MPSAVKTTQSSTTTARHKAYGPRTTVLHLCRDLEPDEAAREIVDLALLTRRAGWRSLIASAGGPMVNDAERAGIRHARIALNRQGWLADWQKRAQLEAVIQKERPSLMHVHGIAPLAVAAGLARLHRIPMVADLTQPFADTPVFRKLLSVLAPMPCLFRIPSAFMGNMLHANFGIPAERIMHIPPGIDLRWYNAGSISAERLQALSHTWRLPEMASVFLVPLPLAEGMGHRVFLEAMARLKDENIYAVLVGRADTATPDMGEQIEAWVDELGLRGKVIVPEFCSDWSAACWLSSVIVTPNIAPRGQSLPVLAAQAIGRPVIVSDCGANTELVQQGSTAWIVPPDNAMILADVMRETIRLTTDQRLMMADNTRYFVSEAFPQAQWFNETMDMYEKLVPAPTQLARIA